MEIQNRCDAVPPDGKDPIENYRLIENELKQYSETLHARPRIIVANKMDVTGAFSGPAAEEMGGVFVLRGNSGNGVGAIVGN